MTGQLITTAEAYFRQVTAMNKAGSKSERIIHASILEGMASRTESEAVRRRIQANADRILHAA